MRFVTEKQIADETERELRAKTKKDDIRTWPMYDQLVAFRRKAAVEAGILLTEQQFIDHQARRGLRVGDRVRYVGEAREEIVDTAAGAKAVERPVGQLGTVTQISARAGRPDIITFRPDDLAAPELLTTRWTDLERLPE